MNEANTQRRRPAKGTSLVSVLVLMVAVAAALLLGASLAQAQPVPDADCPGPSDVRVSVSARTAQTFAAENSGKLTSAQAVVANGASGGDYALAIHEVDASGVPTNTVLASTTVPDSQVPDNALLTTVTGDFASPAEVEAGQEYALVVRGPADFSVGVRTGDPCPGERYFSSSDTGAFFQSIAGEDLVLAISIDPFEPFTVNLRDDLADASPGDDVCDANFLQQGSQCTLRAAIQEANTTTRADTINFNIGGSGVQTINVGATGLGGLPEITEPLTIDGYTQRGASPNTLAVGNDAELMIELNGTDAGFSANGLKIDASDCLIRGLVINRFERSGIVIGGPGVSGATNNRVEGNFVGTDPPGSEDRGNGEGVFVADPGNTVGGTRPASRNLISGNGISGVGIGGSGTTNNEVLGNYIGTDRNGAAVLGNAGAGVSINNASNNTVGGTQPGAGNVISGNDGVGVVLVRDAASNEVLGNLIGPAADGSGALGNRSSGVFIGFFSLGSGANTIGGTAPEAANTIAFNGQDGVTVLGADTTGSRILSNSITLNGGLGIDLGDDGPTANDTGDFDTGPNDLQNFPGITSAKSGKKATTIKGTLRSAPNKTFTVQLFRNPQGEDEGETFVGEKSVTTDADGVASFSLTLKGAQKIPRGQKITATATDEGGNTSEFSVPRKVVRQR